MINEWGCVCVRERRGAEVNVLLSRYEVRKVQLEGWREKMTSFRVSDRRDVMEQMSVQRKEDHHCRKVETRVAG